MVSRRDRRKLAGGVSHRIVKNSDQAPAGATEYGCSHPFPSPHPGLLLVVGVIRWLTPPANFRPALRASFAAFWFKQSVRNRIYTPPKMGRDDNIARASKKPPDLGRSGGFVDYPLESPLYLRRRRIIVSAPMPSSASDPGSGAGVKAAV